MKGVLLLILVAASLFAQDQPEKEKDKDKPKGTIHLEEVKDVPSLHADQACNNFSWAVALSASLAKQNVDLKPDFWIDKYYGGSVCLDQIGAPDDLVRKAEAEYVLDDGRHVAISLKYHEGLPRNVADFLLPIIHDELLILFVDGKAEPLVGAMWDEYQSKRGERMIDLKELHVLDPLADTEHQRLVLDMTGDDVQRITGFIEVRTTETNQQYWPQPK